MVMVIGVVVALIAAGAAIYALTSHSSTGEGCVTVAIASSMGGGVEHACGKEARDWCRAASGRQGVHAEAVQAQCRVAGILP
jgi:hypothetical protein